MNPKRITLVIAIALVAIGGTALATAASQAIGTTDPVWTAIERARAATAKYQDVHRALRAGYARVSPCVEAPDGSGAMGLHYLNAAYAKDPAIRADKPELLLYFPRANGTLRLVGVEYWRADADQDLTTDGDRPSLAGIPFQGPMEGHDPEMPKHYDLHAWVWKYNPAGTFAEFNTALHC